MDDLAAALFGDWGDAVARSAPRQMSIRSRRYASGGGRHPRFQLRSDRGSVVDVENRLVGTITFDDVMDVIEEEASEDFLLQAGVA